MIAPLKCKICHSELASARARDGLFPNGGVSFYACSECGALYVLRNGDGRMQIHKHNDKDKVRQV